MLIQAEKSAAVVAGSGLEQAGSPTLAHMPPLTTLAQVGESREVGRPRKRVWQLALSRHGWLAYDPEGGTRGGRGVVG